MNLPLRMMLGKIPMFQHCTEDEIEQIAALLILKEARKKEIVFNEGDPCEVIYFIHQGRVKIYKTSEDGREQIVNLLGKGDMFPHVGWYGGSAYPATAEILEEGELYFMYVQQFTHLLEHQPKLTLKLLQELDTKIRGLQSRLSHVLSKDMTEKIVSVLQSLANEEGKLDMELTHQDIANMVGTTRETASRILNQLKKEGKVQIDHKFIKVKLREE
ncbi:Crp/Fnr family transcriptional regulator [Ammoniphilus sp. YIM 78166]|uniref:Crp/Fnr family transcriptional regulator n=1 Tax=Ammoniphilus sp. YIM 78166 TaxID=1644106 RepID=UPI0014303EF5|nr:Crp/Fnr family transcriptional regulator [Ammoniphilus sp. YIM 78166]